MHTYRVKKIHMLGIGGAGMGPLAELLFHLGYTITGSDRQRSEATARLASMGIVIQYDHVPHLVRNAELVVYSSAIPEDNPERHYAAENGLRQIRRAELLGDLMRGQTAVCVCGTHGKTTTTALIGALLKAAKLDPTVLAGGMLRGSKTHALVGKGNLMVAEADEFDRSFLAMHPTFAVITNIDVDHLDCYRDIDDIKEAFIAFARKVPFFGEVIACMDDPGVCGVLPSVAATVTTYGIDSGADYRAVDIECAGGCADFNVTEHGVEIGHIKLSIPGMHNVRNALAAIAVARLFEIDFQTVKRTLSAFKGVRRRFEVIAAIHGQVIVDDYAHHPRELQATIDTARGSGASRVVAVFQPHLYSRTRDFLDDFAAVLMTADVVYVTDIYRAREEPMVEVSAGAIIECMADRGHRDAHYIPDHRKLPAMLPSLLRKGDYLLFMGAGDINESARRLAEALHAKA
ncbi:MAG: UDP-N-acetylmuramate--L-alanine ligase [Chitinispirillaceae bacterium]|nr:UDP-N-acetylmuramate--L-alanine ligase [Chitinispirillaceae bacterium]